MMIKRFTTLMVVLASGLRIKKSEGRSESVPVFIKLHKVGSTTLGIFFECLGVSTTLMVGESAESWNNAVCLAE